MLVEDGGFGPLAKGPYKLVGLGRAGSWQRLGERGPVCGLRGFFAWIAVAGVRRKVSGYRTRVVGVVAVRI